MNHAVFCVTPSARASSQDDVPFFVAISHTATNQEDKGKGLSSKMVSVFAENCLRHPVTLHWYFALAGIVPIRSLPHFGQSGTPPGHLISTMYAWQTGPSEKYRTASISVLGSLSFIGHSPQARLKASPPMILLW